jgi:hypothetical protein
VRTLCLVSALALTALAAGLTASPAAASTGVRYGIQDDAWLQFGPGTVDSKLDLLDKLGVDIVRYTVRWDQVAKRRPARPRTNTDPAYKWGDTDAILRGLRARGIGAVVTLLGAPRWANGDRSFQWAPKSGKTFADFAYAAAKRYPWVRDWLIWNEPNQRRWLQPTSPPIYVGRLLNPAYAALHSARRGARVGGGVTAPRANAGGVSPVSWIRAMAAAGAKLDAYAHHPYPERPRIETPTTGGCAKCSTITMATLDRLLGEVQRAFGPKRIWLTEYAYQSNPPDRLLGVSRSLQARYIGEAASRVYRTPRVDMLIQFLIRDDRLPAGWQSGLFTASGARKPAANAFRLPLAEVARRGTRVSLWGMVRARSGAQPYRLRLSTGGGWRWVGGTRRTTSRGVFSVAVSAPPGARVQIWSPRDRIFSPPLTLT